MMIKRALLAAAGSVALGLSLALPAFAQSLKPVCAVDPCSQQEVGPFMQGIQKKCGDTGDCDLCDIEKVIVNIGNWILGIVGALVLLFYVWGGIQWLTSGGNMGRVKSGKESIKTATVGLVIVFAAYAAVYSLANALGVSVTGGTCNHSIGTSAGVTGNAVDCSTQTSPGAICGTNSQCVGNGSGGFVCMSRCEAQNSNGAQDYACVDVTTLANPADQSYCTPNLCDGGNNVQCCNIGAWNRNTP